MNKTLLLLIPVALALSGCAVAYDALRIDGEEACKKKLISDRDECLRRSAQPKFEDYQRERDRQKARDQAAASATPP